MKIFKQKSNHTTYTLLCSNSARDNEQLLKPSRERRQTKGHQKESSKGR